jgi:nicotinamide-nucleotide amidase
MSRDEAPSTAEALGEALRRAGATVAVAESLTGGLLTSELAKVEGASEWLRGGVVAYSPEVKHDLLDVRPGPVVSKEAAVDLAVNVARDLGATLGISATGVGGPDDQDGVPAGTVWIAAATGEDRCRPERHQFDGSPEEVCRQAIDAALAAAIEVLEGTEREGQAGGGTSRREPDPTVSSASGPAGRSEPR